MRKLLTGAIVTILLCTSLSGCFATPPTPPIIPVGISFAADYSAVYDVLSEMNSQYSLSTGMWSLAPEAAFDRAVIATTPSVVAPSNAPNVGGHTDDYSKTNVQVEGIDEGDIVKTDGVYIYSLRGSKLSIFKAEGANTHLVSTTEIGSTTEITNPGYVMDIGFPSSFEYANEMYLYENYVVIITQFSKYMLSYWRGFADAQSCNAYIYDVSTPEKPELVHKLGQDGSNLASRLIDNTLYLITTYYVYDIFENEPESYIPAFYIDNVRTLISPNCIAIMPYANFSRFTIVSAIDILSGTITANQTLLGGGSIVYMSWQNLYIADNEYKTVESTYDDGNFTIVDYTNYSSTNITRLDISSGNVAVAAYGNVPGYLGDQFHLDEYQGYLRIVTTSDSYTYSTIEDRVRGVVGYVGGQSSTSNGLYVLDMSLIQVGAVDNLAPDEYVYSVRFDGDIGYFVTFRTVDPLFAVDLSNPYNPIVLSALKIPGFSQYMHVFSDGLLFGLGYNADETTGRREVMKLSMFDTSNPADVVEAHTLSINANYSTALYNHKAIVVDSGKNIISFPADSEYAIYGYNDQTGFFRRAGINMMENWWSDSRGLYISDYFYIVYNSGIAVIDMESFKLIATINTSSQTGYK